MLIVTNANIKSIAKEQKENYDNMVRFTAENIVEKLKECDQKTWKNSYHTILHDSTDNHEAHTEPDNAILTLIYSDNPCHEWTNGVGKYEAKDNFPFSAFAAAAFEEDVNQKSLQILQELGINLNDPQYDEDDEDDEDHEDQDEDQDN